MHACLHCTFNLGLQRDRQLWLMVTEMVVLIYNGQELVHEHKSVHLTPC